MFYFIYKSKHPFFEKDRVYNKPWIWESNTELWKKMLKDIIKRTFLNSFVLLPALLIIATKLGGITFRYDTETFPTFTEINSQIIFFMLLDDISFYLNHRMLHSKFFYKRVHKIHHEHAHSFR
jgi:sterol desaturase/sphingolipid hydroxylase (fatty acid hydroxylase superfamily)